MGKGAGMIAKILAGFVLAVFICGLIIGYAIHGTKTQTVVCAETVSNGQVYANNCITKG